MNVNRAFLHTVVTKEPSACHLVTVHNIAHQVREATLFIDSAHKFEMNLQIKLILSVSVPHFCSESGTVETDCVYTGQTFAQLDLDDTLFAASADEEIARIHPRRQVWHDSPHFFGFFTPNSK